MYFYDQNVTFIVLFVILEYDSSTIKIKWKRVGRKLFKCSPFSLLEECQSYIFWIKWCWVNDDTIFRWTILFLCYPAFSFVLFWAIYSMLLSLISLSLSIWHISVTGYITNDSYREMLTGNRLSAFHVLKSKVHFKTVQTVWKAKAVAFPIYLAAI